MSTFMLIHGAWHGSWCWNKVVPLLRQAGHTVVAPDMPGRGDDRTPCSRLTLDDYVNKIVEVIDSQAEPVILVGHSMGGGSVTQATEARADRIRSLVYLAAAAPPDGTSMMSSTASHNTSISLFGPGKVEFDEANGSLNLASEAPIREIFYGECSEDDVAFAREHLVSQEASTPTMQPVRLSAERYGRVPKIYIECLRDRAIPIALQRAIHGPLDCRRVVSLDTDHSPFFSMPEALKEALITSA